MLILCRQTIASLQKLVEDLQRAQPQQSELERSAAEVVRAVLHLAAGAALFYKVLYTVHTHTLHRMLYTHTHTHK